MKLCAEESALAGCCIEADKHKLSQVIRNFISNALKFTPSGGSVTVRAFVTQSHVCQRSLRDQVSIRSVSPALPIVRVQVVDTGHGIAKVSRCLSLLISLIRVLHTVYYYNSFFSYVRNNKF